MLKARKIALKNTVIVALSTASVVLGTFASETLARAQSSESSGRTFAFSWVRLPGADGCIGAPALAATVEARLGRRVFVPPADAEISVEGTVSYRADTKRYKASFRVADRNGVILGVRDVEESVASCVILGDRFAFVVSVLIDPEAALAPATPLALPPTPAPASTPAPAPSPAPAAVSKVPPRGWRWLAGADVGAAAGYVPEVGWVVSVGALLTPPRWPAFRAKGSSYVPSRSRVEGIARAEIGLTTGELGICPLEVRRAPFGLTSCLGGLVGALSARGEGFPDSRGYTALLGGVVLDVVAELAVTRIVVVTLSPALVVPLSRTRLAYDDGAGLRHTIFEVAPVGGSLALGLAVGSR